MASIIPKQVKKAITDGWAAETLYVTLHTSTFPNTPGAYDVYADLTNELPTAGGYTLGGKEVTGRTSAYDGESAVLDATADIAWPSSTFADVKFVIVRNNTTGKIRAIYELTTAQSVTSGTFTIQWNVLGLIKASSV